MLVGVLADHVLGSVVLHAFDKLRMGMPATYKATGDWKVVQISSESRSQL